MQRRDVVVVAGIAAAARALWWAVVTPHWLPTSDSTQYLGIADNLADGGGFALNFPSDLVRPTAFRPPLYPALLAPLRWATEALWPVRLLSLLLGVLVAVLAAALAHRIAGRRAAVAAGVLVGVYPPLLANDTIALSEPLALALLLGVLLAADGAAWRWCGLACGALLLTRPNAYLVVLVAAGAAWRRAGARQAAAVVGVALLTVAPWVVRNTVQVGTPRLTTSDGFTLAAVYAPIAQDAGTFVDPVFDPRYDGDLELRLSQYDEAAWASVVLRRGVEGIRANPGYVVGNAARNVLALAELQPWRNRLPEEADGRNLRVRTAALPVFYAVSLAGAVGLWRHRRHRSIALAAIVASQFAAVSILTIAPPRLRAPVDLVLCVGAGLLVADQVARRRATPSSRKAAAMASGSSAASTDDEESTAPNGAFQ